ncbi:MAG: YeeE/YedE family protein [Gammaproteobacteria bacterium]|nr:YeeE/YedE family protein [Gammaproteobacteria bacterium]
MVFEDFASGQSVFLWGSFAVAFIMGAVVNKTGFCTMGAISDAVNMGDMGRMRAWFLAITVAIIGIVIMESMGVMSTDAAFPPYRSSQLIWGENIIGGILFGIGMTIASGCGNKTLIRIGGGNIKSIMVLAIIAVIAYYMINPFPGSDKTLMSVLFYDWIRPLSTSLTTNQDLGAIVNADKAVEMRMYIGGVISLILLFIIFKSQDFRQNTDNVMGGLIVGLAVLAGWYISGALVKIDAEGELLTLSSYYHDWDMLSESEAGKPFEMRSLSTQSFTFINPMGQTYGYVTGSFASKYLTFGLMALFGVIAGSFVWSLVSRSFRIEWFASFKDFVNHVIGAVLMGFGGVLAMGCTIGQGITGVSTLAVGSMIALVSIIFGSAITMKVQLYKMMYEDASFFAALITGLVDLRLLPKGMRKLEGI